MRLDVFHHIVDNEPEPNLDYDDILDHIDDKEDDFEASVKFSINKEGNFRIGFEFGDNEQTADVMGQLLFDLSKGNLVDTITDVLMNERENNPVNKDFIEAIIMKWQDMIKQNGEVLATPVVPPTKTFAVSRTQ